MPAAKDVRSKLHAQFLKSELNYEIAEARSEGEALSAIARRLGVSYSYASKMSRQMAWMVQRRDNRPLPLGLTTQAAIVIEDELCFWPTDDDKALVERNANRIFESVNGRRALMAEIGAWILHQQDPQAF